MRGVVPAIAVVMLALVSARTAVSDSHGVSIRLATASSAELSSTFDVTLAVDNTGASTVSDATADVTLSPGTRLIGTQGDLACAGVEGLHCILAPIPAGVSRSYALTIRSDAPGQASVSATLEADGSTATSSSTVSIYTLVLRGLSTTPTPAIAGKPFVASQTLVRSDTGAPVEPWRAACRGSIGATPHASGRTTPVGRLTRHGARLSCTWRLPAGSAGKYVRGLIVASTHPGGMQAKQAFWRRIS
jgi:hypothetical protein